MQSGWRLDVSLSLIIFCIAEVVFAENGHQVSDHVQLGVRRRRDLDLTSLVIAGARDILNQGGAESIMNSQDKTGSLMGYVKQFAVRRVLGDGLVGQVLGRGLLGNNQPATTPATAGFFGRLFGGGKNSDNVRSTTRAPRVVPSHVTINTDHNVQGKSDSEGGDHDDTTQSSGWIASFKKVVG